MWLLRPMLVLGNATAERSLCIAHIITHTAPAVSRRPSLSLSIRCHPRPLVLLASITCHILFEESINICAILADFVKENPREEVVVARHDTTMNLWLGHGHANPRMPPGSQAYHTQHSNSTGRSVYKTFGLAHCRTAILSVAQRQHGLHVSISRSICSSQRGVHAQHCLMQGQRVPDVVKRGYSNLAVQRGGVGRSSWYALRR